MVRSNGEMKGKINWFSIEELMRDKLISEYKEFDNPTKEQIGVLKRRCVDFMLTKGFVFYPDFIGHRIKLGRTGKLKEFGIQFKHIK